MLAGRQSPTAIDLGWALAAGCRARLNAIGDTPGTWEWRQRAKNDKFATCHVCLGARRQASLPQARISAPGRPPVSCRLANILNIL